MSFLALLRDARICRDELLCGELSVAGPSNIPITFLVLNYEDIRDRRPPQSMARRYMPIAGWMIDTMPPEGARAEFEANVCKSGSG
jgi:hypothetical protein